MIDLSQGLRHIPNDCSGVFVRAGYASKLATTFWLFVTFGEHQVMAQLIAKRVLISPLINKDFPVRHPLLTRGNFASMNLNHQK
jgi:hypothetical protein